jgi:hypothetical protein
MTLAAAAVASDRFAVLQPTPEAERLYRRLGYQAAGVVPGYTIGPDGGPIDSVSMYKQLEL